jgi:hypothetical protein
MYLKLRGRITIYYLLYLILCATDIKEVEVTLEQTTKALRGSRFIAVHFLKSRR